MQPGFTKDFRVTSIVNLCRSPASIESFALLFKAPSVERTLSFYTTLFENIVGARSATSFLKIPFSEKAASDLEFSGQHAEEFSALVKDPDGRKIVISSDISALPLPLRSVVVLRSQRVLDTLSFYQQVSSWKEEKHGKGPVHYSSEWGDTLIEIYPQRKTINTSLELVIPVENLVTTIERLKVENFTFLQESSSSALLHDPDQRLVQLFNLL